MKAMLGGREVQIVQRRGRKVLVDIEGDTYVVDKQHLGVVRERRPFEAQSEGGVNV